MSRELHTSEKVYVIALIAAVGLPPVLNEIAPNLLAALKDARALLSDFWPDDGAWVDDEQKAANEDRLGAIDAALAEAEGRQAEMTTNPSKTLDWLARQFRDHADTSPGETHLEDDAAEVEALRDAFTSMLAALKVLERVTSQTHLSAGSNDQDVAGALLDARAAIANAEGRRTATAMNEDRFDELIDDATHAVNDLIPGMYLDALDPGKRTALLHAINDVLTPILRDLIQPGKGDER